jgi:hypothetical protein
MMGHKDKLKSGDEYDLVFSRRKHKYLEKPGICKRIKNRINRRFRYHRDNFGFEITNTTDMNQYPQTRREM